MLRWFENSTVLVYNINVKDLHFTVTCKCIYRVIVDNTSL